MKKNRSMVYALFYFYAVSCTISLSAQISNQSMSGLKNKLAQFQKNLTDFSQCITGKKECTQREKIVKYTAATAIGLFLITALIAFRVRTADRQTLDSYEKRVAVIEQKREELQKGYAQYWDREGRDPKNDTVIYNFFGSSTGNDLAMLKNNLQTARQPFPTFQERKHFIKDNILEHLETIESDLKRVEKILAKQ